MASTKQIQILQSFGFANSYAESLPNFHAHQLIEQLYHISKTYLGGDRTLLKWLSIMCRIALVEGCSDDA
jgi:hypothetical protein